MEKLIFLEYSDCSINVRSTGSRDLVTFHSITNIISCGPYVHSKLISALVFLSTCVCYIRFHRSANPVLAIEMVLSYFSFLILKHRKYASIHDAQRKDDNS